MTAEDVFGIVGTTQAGNFRVERVVAEGGFAVVYRALHGGFRAPVAIKCLKIPEQMSAEQRNVFLEKFREEAELMFRLSAAIAEICRPLHVDVLNLPDGRFVPFLALEWLDGESLDGIITRRREQAQPALGLHKVVKMMRPIAAALAKAHHFPGPNGAIAIIHRDLKPENLFVANIHGSETMKILDFGIAKAKLAATQAVGRVTGHAIAEDEMSSFTPAYGAPEQWTPKTWGETGPWTDVWGLALSMTEALCGHPPIDGEPWAMRRVCLDTKRRPTPRNHGADDVPAEVERVFEQALALDPRRRFMSVEAFWTALEKAMGLPPTLGPRDGRREPSGSDAEASPPPAATVQAPMTATGERLARIELQKMKVPPPASQAAPPSLPVSSKPASPRIVAAPVSKPEPSGEWEFDLPSGAAPAPSAAGLGSDLEMSLPLGTVAPFPPDPPQPPPPAPPEVRRASLEMELPLRSRSDPPPAPPPEVERSRPGRVASEPTPPATQKPQVRRATAEPDDFGIDLPQRPDPPSRSGASPTASAAAFEVAAVSRRSNPGAGVRHDPPLHPPPRSRAGGQDALHRLRSPLGVLVLALTVAGADIVYHRVTGGDLMFLGIRPFYLAAPLALIGVGFTLWRLMEVRD